MEKTGAMRMLEQVTGRDIRSLILDAVRRTGSIDRAAEDEFNMTGSGLRQWIAKLDGKVTTRSDVDFADFEPPADNEPAAASATA